MDNLEEKLNNIDDEHNYSNHGAAINNLSDDCLRHIFHRLPIIDRVRIERGNKILV